MLITSRRARVDAIIDECAHECLGRLAINDLADFESPHDASCADIEPLPVLRLPPPRRGRGDTWVQSRRNARSDVAPGPVQPVRPARPALCPQDAYEAAWRWARDLGK